MYFKSVKSKLSTISGLTIIGFSIMIIFVIYMTSMQKEFSKVRANLSSLGQNIIVISNQGESINKEFFETNKKIKSELNNLQNSMKDVGLNVKSANDLKKEFQNLEKSFSIVFDKKTAIDNMIVEIKSTKKNINDNFSDVSDYKLLYLLKELESYENSFFLDGVTQLKKFNRSEFKMRRSVRASFNFTTNKEKQKQINNDLIKYKKLFNSIVQESDNIEKLKDSMSKNFTNSLKNISNIKKEIEKEIDNALDFLFYLIIVLIVVVVLVEFVFAFYVSRGIIKNLEAVKNGLNGFFDVINYKSQKADLIKVNSKDEFYVIACEINENIQKSVNLLNHNKEVLEEANDVLQKVANGFYGYKITHHNNVSPDVKSLIINVNKMMDETRTKFDILNNALQAYGRYEFDYVVPKRSDKGLYGDFGTLIASTKLIGNNVAEFLAMILNTGTKLNEDTSILSNSSLELSNTSNSQAASLEETAAAVEQITSNIQNNTVNVDKMSQLANELVASSKLGKEQASTTAIAMDDINSQVTAISDAISIIDKIAFQTNILSLNAAVEAATAGEAGKGFAVVAQEVRNLASRSAEAAREIKDLVEKATQKASNGKEISQTMSEGYDNLNEKITTTIELIEQVSIASNEQKDGMVQINDAISELDKNTQINAANAKYIADLSTSISKMATNLLDASSNATFNDIVKKQVCDVDLVYKTAQMKNDHISFKVENYAKVGTYDKWSVKSESSCRLGSWISECEQENRLFVNSSAWSDMKIAHVNVHRLIQEYVDKNAQKVDNKELRLIAQSVENNILTVFDKLNEIKVVNCEMINNKN